MNCACYCLNLVSEPHLKIIESLKVSIQLGCNTINSVKGFGHDGKNLQKNYAYKCKGIISHNKIQVLRWNQTEWIIGFKVIR